MEKVESFTIVFIRSRGVFGIAEKDRQHGLGVSYVRYTTLAEASSRACLRISHRDDTVDMSVYLSTDPFEWEDHQIDMICMMMPEIERSLVDKASYCVKMLKGKI